MTPPAPFLQQDGPDLILNIKAVPGASLDAIAGQLGDRLKVRVSAPAEGGRANKAVIQLLARTLQIKPNQITIASGSTSPEKTLRIQAPGLTAAQLLKLLAID